MGRPKGSADAPLNDRQRLFVEGVVEGKTPKQAAIDAGYNPEYAGAIGSDNVRKPHIHAAIQKCVHEITGADDREVLGVLAVHLRGDIADLADFFLPDGSLDLKAAQRAGVSRTVKKYKTRRAPIRNKQGKIVDYVIITEVEMYDAQAAARTLADIMGIKQMPRTNDANKAHEKEMMAAVKTEVERLVHAGWSESDARAIVIEAEPLASQWLQ